MPTCERAKIVVNLFEDSITMVRAQQWSSDCLDSIIYLATRSQPATKLHALSTDPALLREMLAKEYKMRRNHGAPEVLDAIMECGDNHDLIINKAVTEGFIKLDMDQLKMGRVGAIIPRGRESTPQLDTTEKLRQAEMAKVEAKHQRETAQLEYEIVQLQRMKAEEQAKQQEAIQRITAATDSRSPTTIAPKRMTPITPPRAAASADSPSLDADARAEAIARAAASRAAKLGVGHHASASTANSATPPTTKVCSPVSTVKAPAPPLAAPDAKRPRVAIPVGSPGGKPAEEVAKGAIAADTKPGANTKQGGTAKGKVNEPAGHGKEAKVAAGAARDAGKAKETEGRGKEAMVARGAANDVGKAKDTEGLGKEAKLAQGAAGHAGKAKETEGRGKEAKSAGGAAGHGDQAKGKGKSEGNDSRPDRANAGRGTLASTASDAMVDRTDKGMPETEGKAEVHKNKGEAKLVAESNSRNGEIEATEETGEAEEEEAAKQGEGEEIQGAADEGEVEEAEDEKSQGEVQEDEVEAGGMEDEGEEDQGEVQEGDVEEAEAIGGTHEAEAVETKNPEAEEDMGEAAEDADMGQVGVEDEAEDDMDKAEGDAGVVEGDDIGETEGEPAGMQAGGDADVEA